MNNKSSKKMLCNDCGINYISKEQFEKNGKCLSCKRRETMARTQGKEYVKYIDLPQEEKDRLQKLRAKYKKSDTSKNSQTKDSNKNTVSKSKSKRGVYTPEVISKVATLASKDKSMPDLRKEVEALYPDLAITSGNFYHMAVSHGIPFKQVRNKKSTVSEDVTVVENESINKEDTDVSEIIITPEVEVVSEIPAVQTVSQPSRPIQSDTVVEELDVDGDPIRLKAVKEEVISVLNEKYEQAGCANEFSYSVKDYVDFLNMLEYLANNIDNLIKNRDAQFNIINDYQFDIIHEMENELAKSGDTYLQDKMYVMRDFRRYMEMDFKALRTLRPLLKLIKVTVHPNNPNNLTDNKSIIGCLNVLNTVISQNAQPRFTPRVDMNLAKKYDWAYMRNSVYKKNSAKNLDESNNVTDNEDIISNDKSTVKNVSINKTRIKSGTDASTRLQLNDLEIKKGLSIFRVSCKISGGNYGVFSPWYKDYKCTSNEVALAWANQEFAIMRGKGNKILISDIDCHKIN